MKNLQKFIQNNLFFVLGSIVMIPIISHLEVQVSILIGNTVDSMNNIKSFTSKLFILLFVLLFKLIADKICLSIFEQKVSSNLVAELKNRIMSKTVTAKYSTLTSWNQNDLFQMYSRDVYDIQKISINAVVHFLINLISAVIAIYQMYIILPILPFVACGIYLLSVISINPLGKLSKKYEAAVRKSEEEINKCFFQIIKNIVLIRIYGKEYQEMESIKQKNNTYSLNMVNSKIVSNFYRTLNRVINAIAPAAIVVICSLQYMEGKISIGQIITAVGLLSSVCTPIQSFGELFVQIKGIAFKIKRIKEFLSEEDENTINTEENKYNGDIKMENLCYSVNNTEILKNISCQIKAGQKTAIIGESGSGKSTLANIISGLVAPTNGKIIIGDTVMKDDQMSSIRFSLSYIQSKTYICDDTVMNNLLLSGAEKDRALHTSNIFSFDDIIKDLSDGYETIIGPHGKRLSDGQSKRLGLARGMAVERNYYLLDEATTGLDSETALKVMDTLINNFTSKTIIMITHDLTKIDEFDNIIVMHSGEVVGTGRHDDLYKQCSHYKELYDEGQRPKIH